ncbi:hypothetical protein ACJ73_02248 [Blastomyces percursus]|uniref:Uncharacterized protein n=1 Tax=Blastomyces percursus TaxID=1658174 RepID=A0A1J9RFF6_9EURO|nr:hypothetical protein ACJ73_02248 [Blastomyces percursus]
MPRTLPWQVDQKPRKSTTPTASSSKRQSRLTSSTATGLGNVQTPSRGRPRIVRTPSTSPPCEVPPVEFMKEGLDNDDQYIMVEDEFLATAQSFTRHLHHAEYVRKKNETKTKNARAIQALVRPTGGNCNLSAESRRNMQSEENSARHEVALSELKRIAGRPPVDSEVEDEGIDSEEDKDDDPWVGTSLQNLMTHQTKHQSLVGLHGIKSTTRAALGFSKAPVGLPGGSRRRSQDEHSPSTRGAEISPHFIDDESTTGDDDDLDAQPRRSKSVQIPTPNPRPATSRSNTYATGSLSTKTRTQSVSRSDPQVGINVSHEHGDSTSHRRDSFVPPKRTSRIMSLFNDSGDEKPTKISKNEGNNYKAQIRKRSPPETSSNKRHEKDGKSKKSRLNEVPTFLL